MRTLAILMLLMAACAGDKPEEKAAKKLKSDTKFDNFIYAIVAANPEDGDGQLAWIEEQANWTDASSMVRIGEMIRRGVLVITDKGVRAVPPKEWPK